MFNLFLLTAICSLLIISSVDATECIHRSYGQDSTVCVCTTTHCDSIEPTLADPKSLKPGVVTSYVTSRSGDRLAKQNLIHFVREPLTKPSTAAIQLDPSKRYQKILGFGGAFTDAAGINIASLKSKELQKRLIADYFGSDGIEYSLARIPIGGCDFSPRVYTYDDYCGDVNLTKWALQVEDLQFKIPFIRLANQLSPRNIKLFASPWSPPAWMKTTGRINNGSLIGKPGELYYKSWARYLVKFLDAYAQHNVTIWGLTVQNEPEAGSIPGFKWNALALSQPEARDFIKFDLGPELHRNGYTKDKLKVIINDGQLPFVRAYAEATLSDPQAAKYISGIGFHWYTNMFADWNDLDITHARHPDYFLLATEACLDTVTLGSWTGFTRYAVDIIKDLNHFTTGWTDWNLALSTTGGPNWVQMAVNAPIIVNASSSEYYKQPIFYAMGHFSKFLPPDSIRIGHTVISANETAKNILLTSFLRPDNGTVLTILNPNPHNITVQVSDARYGYLVCRVKAEAMQTFIWY